MKKDTDSIALAEWSEKSSKLIAKVRNVYSELGIPADSLPDDAFDKDKRISLVFAGQYSAGKSTILKALTGINDIVVKEGIATQETHEYEWMGMTVIDTPGIGTKLRPDHDEIAMKAISQADILVYVVTYNLFDDQIGSEFRRLIITNDKAKETILVVNKMADNGNSNTDEVRKIKTDALRNVTDPYSPESLHVCFVDAESYIDSKTESDEELAQELRDRSNYTGLVKTLNEFVAERAISVKLTTALYRVLDSIQDSVTQFLPSSGDEDIDGLEETLLRQKGILSKTIKSIESETRATYRDACAQIREVGSKLANSLDSYSSQSEVDDAFRSSQDEVDEIAAKCSEDIESVVNDNLNEYDEEMEEYFNSPFRKKIYQQISEKDYHDMPILKKIVESEALSKGGTAIVNHAGGAGVKGLGGLKGTDMHQLVVNVGHFFGHSFKPWEAVKITKGINIAGKVLGIAGIVLSMFMQGKEDYDAEQNVKKQRQAREQIRAAYNSAAEELETHCSRSLKELVNQKLMPKLEKINESISQIRELRTGKSEKCDRLMALEADCRALIGQIHSNTD